MLNSFFDFLLFGAQGLWALFLYILSWIPVAILVILIVESAEKIVESVDKKVGSANKSKR